MRTPNYVIVKLDPPVGPEDAQNLAQHIVQSLEFSDVESAQPAYFDGVHGLRPQLVARYGLVGEEVLSS